MPYQLAPDMFAKVMSLPEPVRVEVLELIGGSTIDEKKLPEIIEETATRLETRQRQDVH